MSDIVQRLRSDYCSCHEGYKIRRMIDPQCESCGTKAERNEAADTIEAQAERVRVLREALSNIKRSCLIDPPHAGQTQWIASIAQTALKATQ